MRFTINFLLLIFVMACSPARKVVVNEVQPTQQIKEGQAYSVRIVFGNSGGFTGETNEYWINPEGQLYKNKELIGKLEEDKHKEIVEQARQITSSDYKTVGNLNQFVRLDTDGKSQSYTWFSGDQKAPKDVIAFYTLLNKLINNK